MVPFRGDEKFSGLPGIELLFSSMVLDENRILGIEQRSATQAPLLMRGQFRPENLDALSHSLDAYYLLAVLIYTFSNGFGYKFQVHFSTNSSRSDILDTILEGVPRRLLFSLFQDCSYSMRATWEGLLRHVHAENIPDRRNIMRSLLQVGIYNDWLNLPASGHYYLCCACKIADLELVQRLWANGCRVECDWETMRRLDTSGLRHSKFTLAVLEALHQGSLECAQFIVERLEESDLANNFVEFQRQMGNQSADYIAGLDIFLKVDAPVDLIIPLEYFDPHVSIHTDKIRMLYKIRNLYRSVPQAHRLSILDYYFYFDRAIFLKMVPYSRVPPNRMTRSGIVSVLEVDTDSLQDYLLKFSTVAFSRHLHQFLELLFAEQILLWSFFGGGTQHNPHPIHRLRQIQMNVLQGLLDFGVDTSLPSLPGIGLQDLLFAAIINGRSDTIEILRMLFEHGAISDADALEAAVERGDMDILRYIATCAEDIDIQAEALVTAIANDNHEAVQVLLDAGVDPTATTHIDTSFEGRDPYYSVVAEAVSRPFYLVSQEMMAFLLDLGFEFKAERYDQGPFGFIRVLLLNECLSNEMLFETVKYILTAFDSIDDVHSSEVCLIGAMSGSFDLARQKGRDFWAENEAAVRLDRLRLLQYLFRLGANVRNQMVWESPFVVLICLRGPEELVEEFLKAGADIQSYGYVPYNGIQTPLQVAASQGDKELVKFLLEKGADVNRKAYCPGSRHGPQGATALQGICSWNPATSAERETRMEIIKRLLDDGADVNTAPSAKLGHTALQAVAIRGDLEIATLLVDHGADVNAPRCRWYGYIALDGAAVSGRLDMVKFLLNAGALSHDRGKTGYDGAIREAKRCGHFVIADLIQQHAADNARSGFNPCLGVPDRDYHEYGSSDSDSESDVSDVASTHAATTLDPNLAQQTGPDGSNSDLGANFAMLDGTQDRVEGASVPEQHLERQDTVLTSEPFNDPLGHHLLSEEVLNPGSTASAFMEFGSWPEEAMADDQDERLMDINPVSNLDTNMLIGWPGPQEDVISQGNLDQQTDLYWSFDFDIWDMDTWDWNHE